MSPKNILLVEGESDKLFFKKLCTAWKLPVTQIDTLTPRDATGQGHNGKQAALSVLGGTYLSQLNDGQVSRLGIVIDADRAADGGGFQSTLRQLSGHLGPAGYALRGEAQPGGLFFAHNDGLHDIGAWVMPNNADEGALEHWVRDSLHPNEADLMRHVRASIDQIPNGPKFRELRRIKAEIATWLAWQEDPDHGLWQAARPGLLDDQAVQFRALKGWLERVFPAA